MALPPKSTSRAVAELEKWAWPCGTSVSAVHFQPRSRSMEVWAWGGRIQLRTVPWLVCPWETWGMRWVKYFMGRWCP